MTKATQRRLAAIVAADVVGYSRLMGADEEGTLATLQTLRRDLLDPAISRHNGRIVKTTGDGLLLEFASVLDAVRCSIAMQAAMADAMAERPDDERMLFRIGVNLGDIIIDGDDIHGDGVNVAARLEALAEPGGLAISGTVHEQVQDKLDTAFIDAGPVEMKNIARPVQVWHWTSRTIPETGPAGTTQPLPAKPSIAVLPFANMSGDPEQEYFSDGITEDIITALSKFRWFFVIARNSAFVYKGRAVDVSQVGAELGVRYVLEGSVRKAGDRIRVTAQLIEAENASHVWAERYDRKLEDIFELQDEITATIAAAVEPELAGSERRRALRKPTEDLDAWDLFQRGVARMWLHDRAGVETGRALFAEAVARDSEFGQARGYLAFAAFMLLVYEWAEDRDTLLREGLDQANRALSLDEKDYFALHALGRLHTLAGNHAAAVRALEASIAGNPNFVLGYAALAEAHVYGGDPRSALEYAETAMRLSPADPMMQVMLHYVGSAHIRLDDYDAAITALERACDMRSAQYVPYTVNRHAKLTHFGGL